MSAGRCVWWEWAGGITPPKAFGQVCLLRPSSFVFLMWCFCSPFEKRGCSCHFYWRSFIARLNGLKWQLSLPLLSLFFPLSISPTRPLTRANQRKFARLLCAHPPLSHPSPMPSSKPKLHERKTDSCSIMSTARGVQTSVLSLHGISVLISARR